MIRMNWGGNINNPLAYTILVFVLDFVMGLLAFIYFWIRLPEEKPHRTKEEFDLLNNYDLIKYKKKQIRILKVRLFAIKVNNFFIKLFHIKRRVN